MSTVVETNSSPEAIIAELNNKANKSFDNVSNTKGILVENYVNGSSWYRIYADGFCEQGGYYTESSTGWKDKVIQLLVPYKDDTYTITTATNHNNVVVNTYSHCNVYGATAESFHLNVYIGAVNTARQYWKTEGYIR